MIHLINRIKQTCSVFIGMLQPRPLLREISILGTVLSSVRPKLHYTDTGYVHLRFNFFNFGALTIFYITLRTCTTPPTDTTNGRAHNDNLQQICHIAMPGPNISTCPDVGMWQIFVRWWWLEVVELLWARPLVVSVASKMLYNKFSLLRTCCIQRLQLVVSLFDGGVRWWCP